MNAKLETEAHKMLAKARPKKANRQETLWRRDLESNEGPKRTGCAAMEHGGG